MKWVKKKTQSRMAKSNQKEQMDVIKREVPETVKVMSFQMALTTRSQDRLSDQTPRSSRTSWVMTMLSQSWRTLTISMIWKKTAHKVKSVPKKKKWKRNKNNQLNDQDRS